MGTQLVLKLEPGMKKAIAEIIKYKKYREIFMILSTEMEIGIFFMRYDDKSPATLNEIAMFFHITKERVRQICKEVVIRYMRVRSGLFTNTNKITRLIDRKVNIMADDNGMVHKDIVHNIVSNILRTLRDGANDKKYKTYFRG